tara:strand:+ start:915 stop:1181 length:267 start_codon:yes stop_codon:yes gene_type:complete
MTINNEKVIQDNLNDLEKAVKDKFKNKFGTLFWFQILIGFIIGLLLMVTVASPMVFLSIIGVVVYNLFKSGNTQFDKLTKKIMSKFNI